MLITWSAAILCGWAPILRRMGGSLVTRSADLCITQPKLCSKYNPSRIRRFLHIFLVSRYTSAITKIILALKNNWTSFSTWSFIWLFLGVAQKNNSFRKLFFSSVFFCLWKNGVVKQMLFYSEISFFLKLTIFRLFLWSKN